MRNLGNKKEKYMYPKIKSNDLKKHLLNNNMQHEEVFYYPNVDIRKERTNSKVFEAFLYFVAIVLAILLIFVQIYGTFIDNRILVRHKEEGTAISKLEYIYNRGELQISFFGKACAVMPSLVINGEKIVDLSDNVASIVEIKANDVIEIDCEGYEGTGYAKIKPIYTINEDFTMMGDINLEDFRQTLFVQQGKKYDLGRVVSRR